MKDFAGRENVPSISSGGTATPPADPLAELAGELTKARQALWPLLGNCPDCGRAVDRASVAVETAIEKLAALKRRRP